MRARLKWYLDPPTPHQLKKEKKNVVKVGPPLTKFSGSAHAVKCRSAAVWFRRHNQSVNLGKVELPKYLNC